MANVSKEDVIEFIANMTVLDLSELIKELEEKFGVSAAAPVAMMAAGPGAGEVLDGKNALKNGLQADILAFFGRHIHLQKTLVGLALHTDEIGNVDDLADFAKIFT